MDKADHSPHRQRFITVTGFRLHVLDWGGRGPVILLLPGWGLNAHVYDDLAPKLTDRFHVLALTIRGFVPSDAPEPDGPSGPYRLDRIVEDVRAVLDTIGAPTAVLVAHSASGAIVTDFAARYPERLRAAIYLDAAFDYAASDSIVARRPFRRPPPPGDTSFAAQGEWARQYFIGAYTAALAAADRADAGVDAPAERARRQHLLAPLATDEERFMHPPDFSVVRAPALAICALATPLSEYPWLTPDSARWAAARNYVDSVRRPFQRDQCERFARTAAHGQIIFLDGNHFIFITREADVIRAVRTFLLGAS